MYQVKIPPKLVKFFSQFPERQYHAGETILNAADQLDGAFFLKEGLVRFYSLSPEGKQLTFNIFKPGSFFPITWALGNQPNAYYYETMTKVSLNLVPQKKLLELLRKDNKVVYDLAQRLSRGLAGFLVRAESLLYGGAEQKVASVLLMLASRFGKQIQGKTAIVMPLTHQEIAGLTNMTREAVSIQMKKFQKQGLIEYQPKKVTLVNQPELETIAALI